MRIFKTYLMALILSTMVVMFGCGHQNLITGDITAPSVSSTIPVNEATGVAINSNISATFTEAMTTASISINTFILKQGITVVPCTVLYTGLVAQLHPVSNLAANTTYNVTILNGIKDVAGNPLAANKTWSFKTGATADNTPPVVSSTIPVNAATGVAINGRISSTFSEGMDPSTITNKTFTLKQGTTSIVCAVTYVGTVATLVPASSLALNTTYNATITTAVKDLAGNAMAADKTWSFKTGAIVDNTPPVVNSTIPVNAATGVAMNGRINSTFSEGMDPSTITVETFTLKKGTTLVPCTVTYVGTVATLIPVSSLAASTTYTATITTGVKDLAGNAIAAAKTWSFTTGATADTTPPVVNSTIPANAATGVAINASISSTFSKGMDPSTITVENFTLKQGTTLISCTVTYVGTVATLIPVSSLASNTTYTAAITTGVKDLAGNAMAATKTWSFKTGATADTAAPFVSSTIPVNAATGVAINGNINSTFSEGMDPSTITVETFTLKQGTTVVPSTVTYVGTVATLIPDSSLASSTTYTATITTGVKDLAGNAMAATKTWSFRTGAAADTTAPTVIATNPTSNATSIDADSSVFATFSEGMDPSTITAETFTLKHGTTLVSSTVTYVGTVATLVPLSTLVLNTTYNVTITTAAKDLAGNVLAEDKAWSFKTKATTPSGLAAVNLGTAGNFAIISKAGISTTGTTTIVGDIGASPVAASYITGFSLSADASNVFSTTPIVTGRVYAANYAPPTPANMTTAIGDMEIAYTNAAGRTNPTATELGAGDISGMTLLPGLYKWSTGLLMTSDITLNGSDTDVWIFQISGDLTLSSGVRVNLTGGAQAKNVFWQTFGATIINTTAHMAGIVMCQTEISLATGATVTGRLMSQTAVSLDANNIVQP